MSGHVFVTRDNISTTQLPTIICGRALVLQGVHLFSHIDAGACSFIITSLPLMCGRG